MIPALKVPLSLNIYMVPRHRLIDINNHTNGIKRSLDDLPLARFKRKIPRRVTMHLLNFIIQTIVAWR